MKSFNHDDIEEVFFNYYEGNLSESEKAALFSFLDENPALYKDFTLWKDAYVHEPLPMIDVLENSLVKKEQVPYRIERSIVFELIVLVGIGGYLLLNLTDNGANSRSENLIEPARMLEAPPVVNLSQQKKELDPKEPPIRASKRKRVQSSIENDNAPVYINEDTSSDADTIEKIENIIPNAPIDAAGNVDTTAQNEQKTVKKDSAPSSVQLSKKELRKIEKAKEKAKVLRQEQEFLKGDRPYVVPIDPNRF